jgi:hypothetical protein
LRRIFATANLPVVSKSPSGSSAPPRRVALFVTCLVDRFRRSAIVVVRE